MGCTARSFLSLMGLKVSPSTLMSQMREPLTLTLPALLIATI